MNGRRDTNRLCGVLLATVVAATAMGSSAGASSRGSTSDSSDLLLPDPHKELRHLSKNLKLSKDQRASVNSILEERAREIHLLLDIDSLSQEYRNTLATKLVEDSNAQIETVLRNKQKRKFDQELAKDHEAH